LYLMHEKMADLGVVMVNGEVTYSVDQEVDSV
jgi:hypothetical protein